MFFTTMNGLVALAGLIAVLLATRRWPHNKRILLLLFNVGFLAVFSKKLIVFYLIYTALNYAGFRFLRKVETGRRFWFIALIFLNVAAISTLRLFVMDVFAHPLFDAVIFLGLIYNVLKVIDALYFAYFFGKDAEAKPLDYFNYILFVPTFTSGPILRFRDFMADAKKPYTVGSAEIEAGIKRVILGLFKKVVLVTWVSTAFTWLLEGELNPGKSLLLMIIFYAWVYFDFSGYSDMAVGIGRMTGYTVPENFKRPFLSPSLTQYWRNWHASLGDWFREHIFIFFSRKTPSKWTAAGLSLLIMVLIGLWHGFTVLYVLWGVYHGLIISLENLLGKTLVNKRKVSKKYFYFRVLLTQAIVLLGIIVYYGDGSHPETVLRIYRGLFNW